MIQFLLLVLACEVEQPTCVDACDEILTCGDYGCADACEVVTERAADEWTECVFEARDDLDVDEYGWDRDACIEVGNTCTLFPTE